MSDYPMLISNKLHSFRNFSLQIYNNSLPKTMFFYKFNFKYTVPRDLSARYIQDKIHHMHLLVFQQSRVLRTQPSNLSFSPFDGMSNQFQY